MDSKKTEVAEIFFLSVMNPWVRWPPSGRSSPMILPWGSTRAVYTAKLAGDPAARAEQGGCGSWDVRRLVQLVWLS